MTKLIASTFIMLYLVIIAGATEIKTFELESFDNNKKTALKTKMNKI